MKTKPLLRTESLIDSVPNCREVKNEKGKVFNVAARGRVNMSHLLTMATA